MARALVISVRLHDGRYHGLPEWPPSPARLFQALLAGAADGHLSDVDRMSFGWLETLSAPTIGSPRAGVGQGFTTYVPNNDLDAVGRDPGRASKIRGEKWIKPRLLDANSVFLYIWNFEGGEHEERHARTLCGIADRLYQFGRGIDMAWAWGELVDDEELDTRLSGYRGMLYRPSAGGSGRTLACPKPGSLESLRERYAASCQRFRGEGAGRAARQLFSQPPKARFAQVAYESPSSRRLYDLRAASTEAPFVPWPLTHASTLVEVVRDLATDRLRGALPDRSLQIERFLVGRKIEGAEVVPSASRVRLVPLPSIGHQHADHGIRRFLVEIPASCPLPASDVHWAFSGLELVDPGTGEGLICTTSEDENMLVHYGVAEDFRFRVWRTVLPAVLPEAAKRRRIEPTRIMAEAKGAVERAAEEARAATAVVQALRHAAVPTRAESIRVQREPFEAHGARAEAFAPGTRFPKERLWHVEIAFRMPVPGPLVVGDGRFLGLGVMAPVKRPQGVHAFLIEDGLAETAQPVEITRALRRAVMARVQERLGPRVSLPTFFTGHERDGSPVRTEHPHLTFAFDPAGARLLIVVPHVVGRRDPKSWELEHLTILEEALSEFRDLRAGSAGRLMLRAVSFDADADPLFAASRTWESVSPYHVTRHTKRADAGEALSADLRAECRRCNLPVPRVTPRNLRGVPNVGLVGGAILTFEVAVDGPIILGRSRHLGGGLFSGVRMGMPGTAAGRNP